jgi:hypothetical protein
VTFPAGTALRETCGAVGWGSASLGFSVTLALALALPALAQEVAAPTDPTLRWQADPACALAADEARVRQALEARLPALRWQEDAPASLTWASSPQGCGLVLESGPDVWRMPLDATAADAEVAQVVGRMAWWVMAALAPPAPPEAPQEGRAVNPAEEEPPLPADGTPEGPADPTVQTGDAPPPRARVRDVPLGPPLMAVTPEITTPVPDTPFRTPLALQIADGPHHALDGVEISLILGSLAGPSRGLQVSSAAAVALGDFSGVQASSFLAISRSSFRGLQVATVSLALGSAPLRGLQVGVGNLARSVEGAQVGVINAAGEVDGVQLGVWNQARRADVQVGVVNIARQTRAPIGVLSVVPGQPMHVRVAATEQGWVSLGLRHGGTLLQQIWEVETRPGEAGFLATGFGLGLRHTGGRFWLEGDLLWRRVRDLRRDAPQVLAGDGAVLRLLPGVSIARRFGVFAGPTATVFVQPDRSAYRAPRHAWTVAAPRAGLTQGRTTRIWLGVQAGLRF